MNVSQALEYERQPFIPMFIYGDHGAMESERQKGEEALKVLETEYFTAEGDPSFDFATVRDLADRNRDLCDQIGEARLRNVTPATLSRGLSDADTCAAIGKMQKRTAASVMREIRGDRDALGVAYARKPIQGTVLGIDIETTGRAPERGYIINVGWEIMELTSDAVPHDAEAHYCGLPDIYRGEDVPLSNIHHITWDDIDGKTPFRENKELQKQLLKLMKKYPYMAHNAAFEDSWFKIHLDGYAEARRVLDGMTARNARWYYLSSLANQGLGNSIDALQDARRAVQLDPNNTEYRMHLQRLQNPGRTYRTQTTYAQPGGIMRWCWSMILLNLLCNCCCGGWGFYGPRYGFRG